MSRPIQVAYILGFPTFLYESGTWDAWKLLTTSGRVKDAQVPHIPSTWRILEFIRLARLASLASLASLARVARQSCPQTAAQDPPSTRAEGQDDVS